MTMPSFLTQCPHCLTSFRVTDSQLEAADGLVRCGACLGIFSAAANRITLKQTPEEAVAAATMPAPDAPEPEVEAPAAAEPQALEDPAEPVREPEAPAPAEPDVAFTSLPPLDADAEHDSDLLNQEEPEIAFGDFNLDSDDDVDADEEEEQEDYEDADEGEEFTEENDSSVYDAYVEGEDDEEEEEEDDEEEEEEEEDDETEAARRAPVERLSTDKAALRRYLAEIEDDEALDPLDDEDLGEFDEPVTLDAAPRRSWLVGLGLLVANVLLVGLLLLQVARANIDVLSRSARFAPLLPYACRILQCPAPDRSQLDRLVSEQLVVRSHPRYAQALEVGLVFRNDAADSQPFPALELNFIDTGNRLVANRLFQPLEYLPAELQTSEMPAGASFQVTLEMADPGSEAVNYTLVFRAP